jgi:DNA polymerase V
MITDAVMELYDRIVDPDLLVRRINIVACNILPEVYGTKDAEFQQLDMFSDPDVQQRKTEEEETRLLREKRRQQAVLTIRKKYGKNAILKGMNYEEGATTRDRNSQIGGHKA